jgi:hypothetical protein
MPPKLGDENVWAVTGILNKTAGPAWTTGRETDMPPKPGDENLWAVTEILNKLAEKHAKTERRQTRRIQNTTLVLLVLLVLTSREWKTGFAGNEKSCVLRFNALGSHGSHFISETVTSMTWKQRMDAHCSQMIHDSIK